MAQTVVLLLLIAAEAVLVFYNSAAMQSAITLTGPGMEVKVTQLSLLASAAGAFVLLWLAGLADRAGAQRRVRRQETTLKAMEQEMLRMKSTAYDQERPPLGDVRVRLETMERDLRAIRVRLTEAEALNGERERSHAGQGGL